MSYQQTADVDILRHKAQVALVMLLKSEIADGKESSRYGWLMSRYVRAWEAYRSADLELFENQAKDRMHLNYEGQDNENKN